MPELSDARREVLSALCDTIVPSLERTPDPDGFWGRRASDIGIPGGVEQLLDGIPDPELRGGLTQLLDVLAAQGFITAPTQLSREQLLRTMCLASPLAAQGVGALTAMTLFLYYGAPDPETGGNPNWATFGYAGPERPSAPPPPKAITPWVPTEEEATLEADVVIVGSGAGGGTIAGTLAGQGLKVVVLEAAGYFTEEDWTGLELHAYQEMYWRGGPQATAEGNVSLQAGTTLGGGTTINWTNCLRTTAWVREQWATEFGLEGVDGAEYDRHLDTVLERIGATDKASDLNKPQERMKAGADALGWDFRTVVRNADLDLYTPEASGQIGWGDPSKLGTERTFLRDAAAHDAEIVVRCRAERILLEGGRAAGVAARYEDPATGRSAQVTVRAPRVVVAGGALESPALLRRSGIGGPAVGQNLRLHPCIAMFGYYPEDMQAWWGAPHAALVDEFQNHAGDGYGFLVEGAQYTTGVAGSALPWTGGAAHKEMMSGFRNGASFIALTRDHGAGMVEVDARGEAVPLYSVTDPLDLANLRLSVEKLARLHEAAGAIDIYHLAGGMPHWRHGDALEPFIAKAQRAPFAAGGAKLFSAHQMGSCRMGPDPAASVANPWGELHDTPGVWIGDGSAFPTPSGTNPMVSIMALAHRTAEAIAGTRAENPLTAATR